MHLNYKKKGIPGSLLVECRRSALFRAGPRRTRFAYRTSRAPYPGPPRPWGKFGKTSPNMPLQGLAGVLYCQKG